MEGVESGSKIFVEPAESKIKADGTGLYYCRLCAELKPTDKFINLVQNDDARDEIVRKLGRINATVDFASEILPMTVCFVCVSSLNSAYQFVFSIERAQDSLAKSLLGKIKEEIEEKINSSASSDEGSNHNDSDDDVGKVKEDIADVEPAEKSVKTVRKTEEKSKPRPKFAPVTTWKDYSWMCSYCDTEFGTIDELQTHSMEYHNTCNAYRCTECQIRKLALDNFLVHVKRHQYDLKFSCYICYQTFTSLKEGRTHKMQHLQTKFVCDGCNHTFPNSSELEKHTNTYYKSMKPKPFPLMQHTSDLTCLLCKKKVTTKGSLQKHLLTHTSDRKRDHICDTCGKSFYTKSMLTGHLLTHSNTRPHPCEICKASFKSHHLLKIHIKTHDNTKPYTCEQCGRCFKRNYELKQHAVVHTDATPYVCSFCNKGFARKSALKQHIRQHTGARPYSCTVCQRDFTHWGNCNKHMIRKHGINFGKKKRTPEGHFPIDPMTKEAIIPEKTEQILEWKHKTLLPRKPSRPPRRAGIMRPKVETRDNVSNETVSNQNMTSPDSNSDNES